MPSITQSQYKENQNQNRNETHDIKFTTAECHGYIISPSATTPYDVVQCPHPPSIPSQLSEECKSRSSSCVKGRYCQMHYCASCRRESQVEVKPAQQSQGVKVEEVQVVEPVREQGQIVDDDHNAKA